MNTETPAWLSDKIEANWQRESAAQSGQIFAEGFSSAFDSARHDAVNMTQQKSMLDLQEKQLQIGSQTAEIAAQKQDAPIWMNYQSSALKDPSTPQPAWQSQRYQTMGQQFIWKQQGEEIQKLKVQNQLDYQKQLEDFKSKQLDINQQKADTYQEKADREATGMASPETKEFADGSKLIHVSPNKWQYVKDGTPKDMSTSQLMAISKSLKDLDPKDATANTIDEALKAKAVQQVKGGNGTTSDITSKVSTYNDEDEARTDGKKSGDIIFLYGVGKVKLK